MIVIVNAILIPFSNDPEFESFWDPVVDITSKKNKNFQSANESDGDGSGDSASVETIAEDSREDSTVESSGSNDESSNDVIIGDRGFQPDFNQSESQDMPLNPVHKVGINNPG